MRFKALQILTFFFIVVSAVLTFANTMNRPDAIWAKSTTEAITLDGKLDEAAWMKAESIRLQYGAKASELIPGSGYKIEAGVPPSDPTDVTFKFLVNGNNLYMAAVVKDSSVGGGLFNRFDGFLMNMRDHSKPDRPAPSFEYFYGWVTEGWADPNTGNVGASPGFFGWAAGDRSVWDGATLVDGVSNDDATPDKGYTVELMFNLTPRGYDVTKSEGDIVEFNVSVYDADWQWPVNDAKFSGNRTWLQGPWGNGSAFSIFKIYARPDVTIDSATPEIGPDLIIPNGANHPMPTIDGMLDEEVWANITGLDIRYGDDELRASYPGIAPYRSGQFQPEINSVRAPVVDPGDATIKWFFKDDMLFLAADVRDQAVWALPAFDQWDGIRFIINNRSTLNPDDNNLARHNLTVRFDETGKVIYEDYLQFLVDSLKAAHVNVSLKPNSTINNFNDIDEGYQIEIAIDLKALGYPAGRGDGALFISATLFDGDSFENAADDYGTRTWFMRESDGPAGPAWAFMDPTVLIPTAVEKPRDSNLPKEFALMGNYPNPFNPTTTIRYSMPEEGVVTLTVFDVLGRNVATNIIGLKGAGMHEVSFDAVTLTSGIYFYRLQMIGKANRKMASTLVGKMLIVK